MKSKRKTHRRSDVLPFSVFALLAISFAASAVQGTRANAVKTPTTQAKETTAAATPNGTAVGTLTVDGKETKVKFVCARERNIRPPDPGGAIDLFITNQPLPEDILTRMTENQYRGSDKIKGIMLTIRPWKLDHGPAGDTFQSWEMGIGIGGDRGEPVVSRFIGQSGMVSDNNTQNKSLTDFKIENGRVRGKAIYKGEDGIRTTTYSISFDAPLRPRSSETNSIKTTSGEHFPKDFQGFLLGKWTIERWRQENGLLHTGTLSVDERLGDDKLRGVFHIVVGGDGRKVVEEVTITRKGTMVHMEGRVISGSRWLADKLTLISRTTFWWAAPQMSRATSRTLCSEKCSST